MKIVNKNYNINKKINKKIVLISDIHYYSKLDIEHLNRVLNKIKNIKPDYICIPGDLVDQANILDEDKLINWLNKLSNISKIILSLGNHEFYYNRKNKIYKLNNKFYKKIKKINNLYFLDNKNVIIDDINFIGLTLPIETYMEKKEKDVDVTRILKTLNIDSKYYNVLLCHSPINLCKKEVVEKFKLDLILCGHMHGGLMPNFMRKIFKNSGIISPHKVLFPKNVYGNFKINKTNIVITSGIMVISHCNLFYPIKNLFASEIACINI